MVRALGGGLHRLRFGVYPHDFLTALLTCQAMRGRVNRSLAEGKPGALLLIDADHFKSINDRWGHTVGDDCLQHLAAMVRESAAGRLSGRLGGDEFVVYTDLASEARSLAERVHVRVERDQRFASMRAALAAQETQRARSALTVTVGVAVAKPGQDFAGLVRHADIALSVGKEDGRNRVAVFGKR